MSPAANPHALAPHFVARLAAILAGLRAPRATYPAAVPRHPNSA